MKACLLVIVAMIVATGCSLDPEDRLTADHIKAIAKSCETKGGYVRLTNTVTVSLADCVVD